MNKYLVIDTETTGLNPERHEMIAFGAIVLLDHVITESIEIKWHPTRPKEASKEALEVNGYNDYNWRGAIDIRQALRQIEQFLIRHSDAVCVGHNLYFDKKFIEAFGKEHGCDLRIPTPYLDTRDICRATLAPYGLHSMRLDEICAFLGWKRRRAHSALSDCEDCAKIIQCLVPPSHKFILRLQVQRQLRRIRGLL